MKQHIHITIEGIGRHPQPVRFEAFKKARTHQITGFVKPVSQTSLLIAAEGEKEEISGFIRWCEEYFAGKMTSLNCQTRKTLMHYNDFTIMD